MSSKSLFFRFLVFIFALFLFSGFILPAHYNIPYPAPLGPQFNQAKNNFFTDGSGDSAYDRVLRMSGIQGFKALDGLTDGTCALVQMTAEVIDLAFVPGFGFGAIDEMGAGIPNGVTNIEWMSGDGMATYHKVLTIAVPRVKSRYDGKSGVAYYSSI